MKMKPLIEKIAENLPAKIICLILAIFIYLIYQFSTLSKKNFSVPLTVQADGDFVVASAPIKTVRITVRGDTNDIIQLQESDFSAILDLSYYAKEGASTVPVQVRLSPHAAAFTPLEVQSDPSSVQVRIEERITAYVPITPVFTGSLAEGYEVTSVHIVPELVQITGPRSLVDAKKDVSTSAIPLNDLASSFSLKTDLLNRNNLIYIESPDSATVAVTIEQKQTVKTFENIDVILREAQNNFIFVATPQKVNVQVKGVERQLENFIVPVVADVDCSAITEPGLYELLVRVALPPEYIVQKIIPEKITITAEAQTNSQVPALPEDR